MIFLSVVFLVPFSLVFAQEMESAAAPRPQVEIGQKVPEQKSPATTANPSQGETKPLAEPQKTPTTTTTQTPATTSTTATAAPATEPVAGQKTPIATVQISVTPTAQQPAEQKTP